MKTARNFMLIAFSSLALAACDSAGSGGGAQDSVHVVGSSTVYPFAKAVSEQLARTDPSVGTPLIESTGTGGGMKLFCGGVGSDTPDVANASRRMKVSEFETCQKNGVTNITEIQVGLDGIAFASAKGGIMMNLSPEIVYKALAARPYGKEQTSEKWSDVDPSLPDDPILVYGPPSTSGTRDALKELILEVGCEADSSMEELKESNEDEYDQVCTEIRSDGKYVDQGEQDNLIVQKISNNPRAVGVFGYSFLEENIDKVQGLPINGSEPTYENISSFSYPGARPLFIYVKDAHLDAVPGLREYIAEWAKSWGKDGPLAKIGLVANPPEAMAKADNAAANFPALTAEELE